MGYLQLSGLLLAAAAGARAWRPGDAAVEAARDATVRCLHFEQKSDAFFHFVDAAVERAVYATPTPTEADAVAPVSRRVAGVATRARRSM